MMPGEMSRKEARDYWDTHDIAEDASEVEVAVKRRPTTVLSVRIDRDRLERLKKLAAAEEIGVVTMARRLLSQAIDRATAPPAAESSHAGAPATVNLTGKSQGADVLTLAVEDAVSILEASSLIDRVLERLVWEAKGISRAQALRDALQVDPSGVRPKL
jgi:hypothetical protein